MSFNSITCDISGAPEVDSSTKSYKVTAANSCGSTHTTLQIGVVAIAPTNLHYTGGKN
jgi:hypothetical protein